MLSSDKPANLSQFSSFVTIPEASQTLKRKKFKSVTLASLTAQGTHAPEWRDRIVALKGRTDAVRACLEKRGLKFNASKMALDAYEQMLARLESELI
jgi:uncharacterized membrane protein